MKHVNIISLHNPMTNYSWYKKSTIYTHIYALQSLKNVPKYQVHINNVHHSLIFATINTQYIMKLHWIHLQYAQ
jgi:hypothetical protein